MKHLKTLNIVNKLLALLYFASGLFPLYLAFLALKTGSLFIASMPMIMALTAFAMGTVMWMLGSKLLIGKWKTGQVVVGGLSVLLFPIGTLYGAYALWVCLKNDAAQAAYKEMASMEVFG